LPEPDFEGPVGDPVAARSRSANGRFTARGHYGALVRKWLPIMVLGLAQFVMVIDGTVMNVSITAVVNDLDTTVSSMQLAIATFTLTMAALMLAGAGIGARIGRRRAFVIGTIIYAVGSLTTALASGFGMLYIGWSIVEGIGAALVIPAIAALAAINYTGRDRAVAYALLGGIAGAAAAAGPLIGGWVTSSFSWRWVFAAETIMILVAILPLAGKIKDLPVTAKAGRFDFSGIVLSAVSMGVVVLALVSASSWGFIEPMNPPFEVFGFSPTIPMVMVGLLIGWAFIAWERKVSASGREPLVGTDLFSIPTLRAGLASQLVLYFIISGSFFVLPLYLQTVLNLDALDSGIRMLPMSVALFLMAIAGSRLATRFSPRAMIRSGIITACFGLLLLIGAITPEATGGLFALAMAVIGIGVGLAISQIGNVNLSSADESRSNEVGGLQGTAQNLGMSLGVALAGTAVFIGLAATFTTSVSNNDDITTALQDGVVEATATGVQVITVEQAQELLQEQGVPQDQADVVVEEYAASKLQALRAGLGIVLIIGLVGLPLTRGLPRETITS
jgi:MFS family permease